MSTPTVAEEKAAVKSIMTPNGLLQSIAEDLRKLKSGSVDLDVARTAQVHYKHMIRLFDVQLQAVRIFNSSTVPEGWSPEGGTAAK